MEIEKIVLERHAGLPPGQRALKKFPRFGIAEFARRPLKSLEVRLEFHGALDRAVVITAAELAMLERVYFTTDFHCAAGWSHQGVKWSGVRFKDVWDRFVAAQARAIDDDAFIVLRCQDGYRTTLKLVDLLASEVLIADRLNDEPLTVAHGAPVRLVAPAHYGYKSAKHLVRLELRASDPSYRPLLPRLLDHPRARVAHEERGQFLPGWLLRYLFRPLIKPLIRKMQLIKTTLS